MAGYTRADTSNNIADGNVINAADFDGEYDAIQAAFNAATGHTHDGSSGEGKPITKVGPSQDVVVSATAVTPKTTATVDLGSNSLKFKDVYVSGTVNGATVASPIVTGSITEGVYTITDGGSVNLTPANGTIQLWTLGANRTPTATGFSSGQSMTLMINDGTAYNVTWTTAAVTWVGGSAPVLATTGYTVIELWKVSTTLYGSIVGYVA